MSGPPLTTLSSMQSEWLTEDWKPSALPDSNWVKPDFEVQITKAPKRLRPNV